MHRARHIIVALVVGSVLVLSALLGGYSGERSLHGPAGREAACDRPPLPGDGPAVQDPTAVTEPWQVPVEDDPARLAEATVAVEAVVLEVAPATGTTPPLQEVMLVACDVLRGEVAAGDLLVVESVGDGVRHRPGDPPYRVGERWMLFLAPVDGDDRRYEVVTASGRHLVTASGQVEPVA